MDIRGVVSTMLMQVNTVVDATERTGKPGIASRRTAAGGRTIAKRCGEHRAGIEQRRLRRRWMLRVRAAERSE